MRTLPYTRLDLISGLVSVALFLASRRTGVTRHPTLWSPDFPLCTARTGCPVRFIPHTAAAWPASPSMVSREHCAPRETTSAHNTLFACTHPSQQLMQMMIMHTERIKMAQCVHKVVHIRPAFAATHRDNACSIIDRHASGITFVGAIGDKRQGDTPSFGRGASRAATTPPGLRLSPQQRSGKRCPCRPRRDPGPARDPVQRRCRDNGWSKYRTCGDTRAAIPVQRRCARSRGPTSASRR